MTKGGTGGGTFDSSGKRRVPGRGLKDKIDEIILIKVINGLLKRAKETKMLTALKGYTTYIVIGFILIGASLESLGFDIPQFDLNLTTAIPICLAIWRARAGAKNDAKNAAIGIAPGSK